MSTPPTNSRGWNAEPVYVFEKQQGTSSATISGRIVDRSKIRLLRLNGESVPVVRYATRYWRVYPPERFEEMMQKWSSPKDRIYSESRKTIKKMDVRFMCDADEPIGHY